MEDNGSVTIVILLSQVSLVQFEVDINSMELTATGSNYRILGIIHERKVSRMNFFGIVREKTFTIQPIPGNLIARISGNIHERKIS